MFNKQSIYIPIFTGLVTLSHFGIPFADDFSSSSVIVITPTRIEVPIVKSPVPVEVITRQEIENSLSTDVADIIQMHSGLEVARNGGSGKVTSIFTRGSESNHTVILIDGVKINPATLGAPAIQNISPSIIDHIEIVKGPRSSVYGSEAIGGVINIITRKQVKGHQTSITLGAGENSSRKLVLDTIHGIGNVTFGLTLDQFDTDGFPVSDDSSEDHGYDNQTVNTYVNYKADHHQINLRHWQSMGNVEYFSFGEQDQDFENSATAFQWDANFTDAIKTSIRVSQITDDIQQNVANFLSQFDKAVTERNELDLKLDYAVNSDSVISVGGVRAVEDVDALSFGTIINEETDINEYYALYQSTMKNHSYALSIRQTDHEDFGHHNTWNLDYQYQLDPAVRFYTGLGSAFRAPDHTDRFGSIGNPDLQPETSKNIELSLIFDLSSKSQFQISFFKNNIENLIEPNGSFTQMINVDETEITGIELSYRQRADPWSYQFNAVLQDPRNKITDEKLSRRAPARVNTQLTYQWNKWQLTSKISVVSARDDSSFNDITLPQYEVVDITAYYQITKLSRVSARLDNLFNEQYETAGGFNTLDRNLMVEYKYLIPW